MARFGSIGTQYLDNSGEVLAGGLLYFFESGSTTAKTTYSNADQTVANTHPVVLDAAGRQPDIFFNGSAKVELRDSNGVLIQSVDPVGGTVTRDAFADWNALITYQLEDIVQGSDDKYYQSVANDNLGNNPVSDSTNWQSIRFIAEWNTNYTYSGGALVTGSDDALYQCVVASSLGEDPTTSADWTKVGSSGWSSLVEDLTPQLGGDLDLNTHNVGAASAADLTKLSELTATSEELNHMDGVTSAVQTQLDAKAPSADPTFSGAITLPGTWTITVVGNDLRFNYGGVAKFELASDGTLTAVTDVGKGAIS